MGDGRNGVATEDAVALAKVEDKSGQDCVITLNPRTMEAHVQVMILNPENVTQQDARPQVNTASNMNLILC